MEDICVCCGIPLAGDKQVCNMCEKGFTPNCSRPVDIQTGIEVNTDSDVIKGHKMTNLESSIFHGWQDLNCGANDEIINKVCEPFMSEVKHE